MDQIVFEQWNRLLKFNELRGLPNWLSIGYKPEWDMRWLAVLITVADVEVVQKWAKTGVDEMSDKNPLLWLAERYVALEQHDIKEIYIFVNKRVVPLSNFEVSVLRHLGNAIAETGEGS